MPDDPPPERSRTFTWEDPSPVARQARRMAGSDLFDKMRRGDLPEPPFARLLGMDLFDAGEGRFTMTLQPQEFHYNPMGCVHGGILSTLLDSVMSAAVHTTLPAGQGYLTLGININFLKPVYEHTGEIMAEGKVVSSGRQVATAEGRIVDARGAVYATGTATCLIFETGRREPAPPSQPPPKNEPTQGD
ncbi:MAG TPA: PaaI family thioesterase [Bryobacteraceae bacterium]|nr:PaaI family thioesterase [Bryobacteraceae bacterium]